MPGKIPNNLSDLERVQQQNREANRKVLQELGLLEPLPPLLSAVRVKRPAAPVRPRPAKKPRPVPADDSADWGSQLADGRRRSTRRTNKPVKFDSLDYGSDVEDTDDDEDYEYDGPKKRKPYTPRIKIAVPKNRENVYGAIPDVPVGTWWSTRLECCADGIHRPTVAGIHGGPDGAYSIALSGGYEDDIDWGECFTYTGEGGRDLKGTSTNPKNLRTAPQSRDQQLTRGNLALSRNVETRTPVRVIRGYKLRSPYAPEEGYRYDGLYWVEKFWLCAGQAGFLVYKYAMRRCEDQPPPPWKNGGAEDCENTADGENGDERTEDEDEDEGEDEEREEGDGVDEGKMEKGEENDRDKEAGKGNEAEDGKQKENVETVENGQVEGENGADQTNGKKAVKRGRKKKEVTAKMETIEKKKVGADPEEKEDDCE